MKRRKFITQFTLAALGLPFISTIINQEIQSHSICCISLGKMAIDTKNFFMESGIVFDTLLSIEYYSHSLSLLSEDANKANSKLLLIAKPSSVDESKVLFSLLVSLTRTQRKFHAYIYLPFSFEGPKLQDEAEKMRMYFKNHENIMFIHLSEEGRRYGELTFKDFFEKIYTKIFHDFTINNPISIY